MTGLDCGLQLRAIHAHVDHFPTARQRQCRDGTNDRVTVAVVLPGDSAEERADGVCAAPTAAIGWATPHPARTDQKLREIQRIHKERCWGGHRIAIAAYVVVADHSCCAEIAAVQSPACAQRWIETPAQLFTYQFEGLAGSIATGPP